MVMGNDSEQNLSKLSVAFDRANTSITRTGQAFGELAKSSQEWNIISRILSGTGMWRLQNQIRAVGNVINVYHNRQKEAMKSTIEAIEANEKLADSLKAVSDALSLSDADIKRTPLAMMFTKAGRDGIAEYKAMWETAGKQLAKAEGGITKSLTPSATAKYLGGKFLKGREEEGGTAEYLSKVTGFGKFRSRMTTLKDRFKQTTFGANVMQNPKYAFTTQGKRLAGRAGEILSGGRAGFQKNASKLVSKLGGVAGKIAQFFVVGVAFLAKALIGFLAISLGIALLIFLIKKMKLRERFMKLDERFGGLATTFKGITKLFGGFIEMFKGAFTGDWKTLKGGFMKMAEGVGLLIKGILLIAGQALLAIIAAFWNAIATKIEGKNGTIFGQKLPRMANGGISGGGLTLVGERGPELVRLPSGARVHSNAESRRMSGSNIHVHVNGRVGASDAEIRDIANKVAREINLKMNRTAHTTGRL